MTKIYLVKFKAWNTVTKVYTSFVLEVFTNKKKAEVYAEYKQLYFKTEKPSYLTSYNEITCKVDEFTINKLDYTKELLKLQTKNLPY